MVWIYCSLRYALLLFLGAILDAGIDPGSTLDRPWVDPESALDRSLDRPWIETGAQFEIDPGSIVDGPWVDPGSTLNRPWIDPGYIP